MALYGRTTLKTMQAGIDHFKAFDIGNVRGTQCKPYQYGRLPSFLVDQLKATNVVYTIYSYQTPIAWYNGTEWVIPDVKYSSSTSGHQSKIRLMTRISGFYS